MYDSVFNRIEQKYLLSIEEYRNLLMTINDKIKMDKFFESQISNIYFDSENNDLIINSIEANEFKHKVRLRSYYVPKEDDDVFLEIKNKYKGIVNKRRIKINLGNFYNYLATGKISELNQASSQIFKEIDYLFTHYKLKPFYYVGYDRRSYRSVDDEELRITFDFNLRSRYTNLKLEAGNYGKLYFDKENMVIMEIKALHAMPLWLVEALSKNNIYPMSISKIGRIYSKDLEGKI